MPREEVITGKLLLNMMDSQDNCEYIYFLVKNQYYNKLIYEKILILELILWNYIYKLYIFHNINLNNLYYEITNVDNTIDCIYNFDKMLIYEHPVLLDLIKYYIKLIKFHIKYQREKIQFAINYDYEFWCNDYYKIYNQELFMGY